MNCFTIDTVTRFFIIFCDTKGCDILSSISKKRIVKEFKSPLNVEASILRRSVLFHFLARLKSLVEASNRGTIKIRNNIESNNCTEICSFILHLQINLTSDQIRSYYWIIFQCKTTRTFVYRFQVIDLTERVSISVKNHI